MAHIFVPKSIDFDAEKGRLVCSRSPVPASSDPLHVEQPTPEGAGQQPPTQSHGTTNQPRVDISSAPDQKSANLASDGTTANPLDDPLSAPADDPLSSASDPLSTAQTPAGGAGSGVTAGPESSATPGLKSSVSFNDTPDEHPDGVSSDGDHFVPWKARKTDILSRYTANERIGVSVSFMEDAGGKVSLPVDQVQQRLDELSEADQNVDDSKEARTQLTQQDYVSHIEKLHSELIRAWDAQERVKSLKIAIQCAKVLGDTNVVRFYPSKFVLITEILDTFGTLVYNRIRNRAGATNDLQTIEGPEEFAAVAGAVSVAARETCRNWLFKIASIRELLPRIYVEIAVLACYRFTQAQTLPAVIGRLLRMIRGIGEPLVALHARAYLARATRIVAPNLRDHLLGGFSDFMTSLGPVAQPRFVKRLAEQHSGISVVDYLDLFTPALDYLVQSAVYRAPSGDLEKLLTEYHRAPHGVVLASLLSSLSPAFIASHALALSAMVRGLPAPPPITDSSAVPGSNSGGSADGANSVDGDENGVETAGQKRKGKTTSSKRKSSVSTRGSAINGEGSDSTGRLVYPRHTLYAILGVNLVMASPPPDQVLAILNDVWKTVTKIERPDDYVEVAEAWIEYPLAHCSPKEVNVLLGDLLAHVLPNRAFERLSGRLSSIVQKVLTAYPSLRVIMTMKNFLPVLDLFEGDALNDVSKTILFSFARETGASEPLADAGFISAMLAVGKSVHDSLNTLSFEDDVRRVSHALCQFVARVDFGRDVEKQLNFYVDCRGAFGNLDSVKRQLILGVLSLAMRTHAIVRGRHGRKTAAFIRAAVAFAFVTIPAMDSVLDRLRLYRLASEVALMNGALPQADSLMRAAFTLVGSAPAETAVGSPGGRLTEAELLDVLAGYASLLVAVPGNPEHGPFYLLKGLLGMLQDYPWTTAADGGADDDAPRGGRARALLRLMAALTALSQRQLPYCPGAYSGNDVLYNQAPSYLSELQEILNKLLETVLSDLGALKEQGDAVNQAQVAADLFELLVCRAELDTKTATLAFQLHGMTHKLTGQLIQQDGQRQPQSGKQLQSPVVRTAHQLQKQMRNAVDNLKGRDGVVGMLYAKIIKSFF